MFKVYLVHGYDSWTHSIITRAFKSETDAKEFAASLTDSRISSYETESDLIKTVDLLNKILMGLDYGA